MAYLNKVMLMGNLTRDVEMTYTPKGTPVGKFGLAVSRKYKTETGELKEETTFVDITLFGRTAEIASQYLSKVSPPSSQAGWHWSPGTLSKPGRSVPSCTWWRMPCSSSAAGGMQQAVEAQVMLLPTKIMTNAPYPSRSLPGVDIPAATRGTSSAPSQSLRRHRCRMTMTTSRFDRSIH